MKKTIIITFTLCCCLSLYNPVKQLIFAEPSENVTTSEQDATSVEKNTSTNEQINTPVEKYTSTTKQDTTSIEKNTITQEQSNTLIEENTSANEQNTAPVKETTSTVEQDTTVVEKSTLTQEQAKELLIKYNNKVNYVYQGDENNFEALQAKGLHGYVFLPDVDTDIGYFVDKESSQIYFFHPSGYLELVK